MEHLSLYWSEEHHLWTETVTMERTRSDDTASFRVGRGAPKPMAAVQCVSGPREEVRTNLIVRPFSVLFHKMREF
jgi:hypothetical protein